MLSKACEYGIRASIFIAAKSINQQRVRLKDVAKEIQSPEAFTAKIMQDLARHHIVNSVKGPKGGFEIDDSQFQTITLKNIVEAIDGSHIFNDCGLGLKECNGDKPCPIHHQYEKIRKNFNDMLEHTSLLDLALKVDKGDTFLKYIP